MCNGKTYISKKLQTWLNCFSSSNEVVLPKYQYRSISQKCNEIRSTFTCHQTNDYIASQLECFLRPI